MGPELPVVVLAPDTFYVLDALECLGPDRSAEKWFSSLEVFDCAGRLWRVADASVNPSAPNGLELFGRRLLNYCLTLDQPREVDLSTVSRRLSAYVELDPDDLHSQFMSHEEVLCRFREALTPEGIIEAARASQGLGTT